MKKYFQVPSILPTYVISFSFIVEYHSIVHAYFIFIIYVFIVGQLVCFCFLDFMKRVAKKNAWTSIQGVECSSFVVNTRSSIFGSHGWYTFNVLIILHTEYNVGIPLSSKPPTNEVFLLPQPCILSSICSFILCLSNWGKMKSQIWFDLT